ncbi:MAG TPA: hypothetical protein VEU29_03440 [Actinomycetota bacterium]|nr:hypothetical protein [Actinomycetota bacterium]
MPRRLRALSFFLLALAACRPDTVDLAYRFAEGSRQYRLEASIQSRWDIGASGSGSCHVVLDVSEEVREQTDETAVVEVAMEPVEVEEEGLGCPRGGGFTLEVDPNGRVLQVLEVGGVDATELAQEEVAFIGTYRPTLPGSPVALGDVWQSAPQPEVGSIAQLATQGELESLYMADDGPVAELSYGGKGPLEWQTQLPQGSAGLAGTAETEATATFDIERGVLLAASSVLSGDFDVRVLPSSGGRTPLTGRLSLDLELTVSASD